MERVGCSGREGGCCSGERGRRSSGSLSLVIKLFFKSKACLPFIGKESHHVPKAQSIYVSKSSKRHFIFFSQKVQFNFVLKDVS